MAFDNDRGFLDRLTTPFVRAYHWLQPAVRARVLWLGLVGIVGGLLMLYLLVNHVVMPTYTRHGSSVTLPDTRTMVYEEARRLLESQGLRVERRDQVFNAAFGREAVIDQNPLPGTNVKGGRRIYLTVNSGPQQMVSTPSVLTLTERVARAELRAAGLDVAEVREDSVYSPYRGTVTRQVPLPGHSVPAGTKVTLWLSPGPGAQMVGVPDVRGLSAEQARLEIREAGLWSDPTGAVAGTITRQEPAAGTQMRAGGEVRIYADAPPEPEAEPTEPEVEPEPQPEPPAEQAPPTDGGW